jgi:hypothetical protein
MRFIWGMNVYCLDHTDVHSVLRSDYPRSRFFLVSQTAISRSRREAVFVVLGITVGVMFWAILALMGLNIIFEKWHG